MKMIFRWGNPENDIKTKIICVRESRPKKKAQ